MTATVAEKRSVSASVRVTVREIAATALTLAFTDGSDAATLECGRHAVLDANLLPKDATDRTVAYRSLDPAVATVDERGIVCGVSAGTTEIVAEHVLGKTTLSARVLLEVVAEISPYVPLRSAEFGAAETIFTGETGRLPAQPVPAEASEPLFLYKSSDPSVLRVDSATGEYVALKRGDATVTATYVLDRNITASLPVKVRNRALGASISFAGTANGAADGSLSVDAGAAGIRLEVHAEVSPVYVRFTSSDPQIAEIFADGTLATYRSSRDAEGGIVTLRVTVADNPEFSEAAGLVNVFEVRLTVAKQAFSAGMSHFGTWIRKLFGHFGAFFVLGGLAALTALLFDNGSVKRRVIFAVLLLFGGFLFAGLTELLQLPIFTAGRGASFGDVLIDFSGYLPAAAILYGGFLLVVAIVLYVRRHKKAKKE